VARREAASGDTGLIEVVRRQGVDGARAPSFTAEPNGLSKSLTAIHVAAVRQPDPGHSHRSIEKCQPRPSNSDETLHPQGDRGIRADNGGPRSAAADRRTRRADDEDLAVRASFLYGFVSSLRRSTCRLAESGAIPGSVTGTRQST